jgi:acyl carrier protein
LLVNLPDWSRILDEATVRAKIRQYIVEEFVRDGSYPLKDDEGIVTGGMMDSTSLAELAVYVEQEFNVYIPDPDLTVAKMDTLNQIVARVMKDLA